MILGDMDGVVCLVKNSVNSATEAEETLVMDEIAKNRNSDVSESDPEDATQERIDEAQDSVETHANMDVSSESLVSIR